MSRVGNRIINIPDGIKIDIKPNSVIIANSKNQIEVNVNNNIVVEQKENTICVTRKNDLKQTKMNHGTVNANIANAVIGLSKGYLIELELKGVGYKAKLEGKKINLSLGYSHPVIIDIPDEITVEVPTATEIKLNSYSKQAIGQFAAIIRKWRKPEPYKGKGILYKGEHIIRKVGKTADKKK